MTDPGRLARVREIIAAAGVDGVVVTRNAGRQWLSGFALAPGDEHTSGWSGTLLVGADTQLVLVDARYLEQAQAECPGWEVRRTRKLIFEELPGIAAERGLRRLGAEARAMTHADWAALVDGGLDLVPLDDELEALRLIKDAHEVAAIERACALADRCFERLVATVRPGMTEGEVAWQIEGWFRANGAEALAFEPIVLVGARAAMPHGKAGDTAVAVGKALLLDFGCQVDGYRSDITRTVFFGEPDDEARRRYEAVRDAQQRAFEAVAVGVTGAEVHAVARRSLEEAGLGEAFTHGLGHGIGLETHEEPKLATWRRPLEAGMVFSIEPGVYLPGEIGIRIEDDVVLEAAGPRRLTYAPRELLVL